MRCSARRVPASRRCCGCSGSWSARPGAVSFSTDPLFARATWSPVAASPRSFRSRTLLRGTVADNVAYGLRLRGTPSAERARRVAAGLERVGLAGWQDHSALTLSGGEAQRVALARALVLEPRFLLLDEPLSYMDPLLKRSLSVEFAQILANERVTALYVTHDQDEAAVVADRIGIMRGRPHHRRRRPGRGPRTAPRTSGSRPSWAWSPSLHGRVTVVEDGLATIDAMGSAVYATERRCPRAPTSWSRCGPRTSRCMRLVPICRAAAPATISRSRSRRSARKADRFT